MRYDLIFYFFAVMNVIGSFISPNEISSALGWFCAIIYCFGYYKFVLEKEGEQ